MFTAGCDDKLDAIDVIGYTGVPVAIDEIQSLFGQICPRWKFRLVTFPILKYEIMIPLTKETVYKIV